MTKARLFTPLKLRGVETKNRIIISPMCQYSADDGFANDWHFVHLGRFAQGGAGIVMVEATAVTRDGRITHGDMGLWSDAHIAPLARIATFLRANGSVPAIQLAHAGRKASMQRPWFGNGPLNAGDFLRGDTPWDIVAPSAIPLEEGWLMPAELTEDALVQLREAWRAATQRAITAGFDILEAHMAHGYLLHSFLSPLSNKRADKYGGSRDNRMRFPLEIADIVRAAWPAEKPMFVRISAVDGLEGGWTHRGFGRLRARTQGARHRRDRLLIGRPDRLGDRGAHSARLRFPAALCRAHPQRGRDRHDGGRSHRASATGGRRTRRRRSRSDRHRARGDVRPELAAACRDWRSALRTAAGELYASWPKQAGWWLERREPGLRKLDGPPLPFRTRAQA